MSRWLPAAVALLLVASCGGEDVAAVDAGSDAGPDAGERLRDAGRDAARDAGRDAGPDGGPDTSGWYDEADWQPLAELPPGCVIERANHPEVLYRMEWTSCGDGCERLLPDPRLQRTVHDYGAWTDGTRGYVWLIGRALDDPVGRTMVVLGTTDGLALGAWRQPPAFPDADHGCRLFPMAVGDGFAGLGLDAYSVEGPRSWALLHAPLSEIGAATEPVAILDRSSLPGWSVLQGMAVSSTTVAAELQPTGIVKVFSADGRVGTLGGTPEIRGSAHGVTLLGETVFFSEYAAYWRAVYGTIDQPATVFREIPMVDVRMFRSDEESLAWLQAYDRDLPVGYGRVELWTAPYTSDPASLAPRLVTEMNGYHGYTLGGGYIGHRETRDGPQRVEVYDLSDGSRRTFVAPPDSVILTDPSYISETEMLVKGRYDLESTVFRVQLDSLSAWGG